MCSAKPRPPNREQANHPCRVNVYHNVYQHAAMLHATSQVTKGMALVIRLSSLAARDSQPYA